VRPVFLLLLPALLAGCGTPSGARPRWPDTWAMQLDGVERQGAAEALVASPYDLLVIEPTRTVKGHARFPAHRLVQRLHARGKVVLAYVNAGQAESYRPYWKDAWRAPDPEVGEPGRPPFLLARDPDGWAGNYPVAYWEPAWRKCVLGLVDAAVDDGFDGVYLDWILGYAHPPVVEAARTAGVDPADEMVELVRAIRERARTRDPDFRVVVQNAAPLAEARPALLGTVDAVSQECTWYGGEAGAGWSDPEAGDRPTPKTGPWSTKTLVRQLRAVRAAGLPVYTIDYALDPNNAKRARERSRANGFHPFVSRSPVNRLP